jgi:2,4-dienoyl-CoA reductase-like NADH-dependent reductase (Old Yellow Enzyme family)
MAELFSPFRFRTGLTLPHRLALAPMTNLQSRDDGTVGDNEVRWLESRARGGFGLIFTAAAHVAKDGQGWPGELGIFGDEHLAGLRALGATLHENDAKCIVQIFHGGARADASVAGAMPWSAVAEDGVRAATEADIRRTIEAFGAAARRAEVAGLDGVEIHGAHGYLLTQFFSRRNTRSDGWGSTLEGRARITREVLRAVRDQVSSSFTVGVRLSPEDFGNAKGLDLDESVQLARWLAEGGADFIHVSLWHGRERTKKYPERHALELFRSAVPADCAIVAAGSIWTRDDADDLLGLGADLVALGRSAIANPAWPIEAKDPAWRPRRPPLRFEELGALGLSPSFAQYMRKFKGFVG